MRYLFPIFFLLPLSASAATPQPGAYFIVFSENLLRTAQILVTFAFLLAILVFAWGIIRFLFSAGDPGASKSFLLWGVVAMAVLASIMGLITFLQQIFGIDNRTGTIEAPGIIGPRVIQPQ